MSILDFATIAFAITGIIATYFPRVPAAVASAFASMVTAHFASATPATETLLFWAVASTIAAGIRYLHGGRRNGNGYVATGTLAGTLLGYLISPTAASLICGGAAGAILAAIAYVRTPRGEKIDIHSRQFADFVGSRALPAIITCTMAAIALSSL
ncbi:MAG: hypothetical protein K1V78_05870 [Muribaculaceae bacterium]